MNTVTSKDGTSIAYDITGNSGPLLLWVTGALGERSAVHDTVLSQLLSKKFRVITYDRRGRGDSGDTQPYAKEREIEDIAALINANGGDAILTGMSSGALLALRAATVLAPQIEKVAVFEPPFIINDSRPPVTPAYLDHLHEALDAGDRSKALELFMTEALRIPDEYVAGMKADPSWKEMQKLAHTLPYDGEFVVEVAGGKPIVPEQWQSLTMPVTVITGGDSEAFFPEGAKALVAVLPDAKHLVLPGQNHAVDPKLLSEMLLDVLAQ